MNNRLKLALLAALTFALPAGAFATEENIKLEFKGNDIYFLIASLVFGLIAVAYGFMLSKKVMSESPGDEKMQEVGKAIRDGALAYLQQQRKTISIFVVLLSLGLAAMYYPRFGMVPAIGIAVCFIAGVSASYIAGYAGMMMAVAANMRTAAAALTSYKRALEVAFRAGGVAGMYTVGLGLIGASIIFFAGGADAMRYLIGFGFGGSLAALFMRVGGGIYTKAADVGADLVGKVEAGIPEDDPRNPAVIADNVGDNVGDCAGMAADVFESYEVTLVAAIVLGAATSAIFPPAIWMKLVLFALMARGVGVVASIYGIATVKGSDDLQSDPLKPIQGGFRRSAVLAAILTLGLAAVMMGGVPSISPVVSATLMEDQQTFARRELFAVRGILEDIAAKKAAEASTKEKKEVKPNVKELKPEDVMKDPRLEKILADTERTEQAFEGRTLQQAIALDPKAALPDIKSWKGYTKLDWSDPRIANYSVMKPSTAQNQTTEYSAFKAEYNKQAVDEQLSVLKLKVTNTPAAQGPTPAKTETFVVYFGPTSEKSFRDNILKQAMAQNPNLKVDIQDNYPANFMINGDGDLAIGVSMIGRKGSTLKVPHEVQGYTPINYYKADAAEMKRLNDLRAKDPNAQVTFPDSGVISMAIAEDHPADWWKFFLCIFFGIAMAFVFEMMTDYYVSSHKKPTNEVAAVASAGPAPMIIQGFALGLESSVFSLLAICFALVLPLMLFPPAQFGGYLLSFYGIALIGLGLLTTTGFILAMDTFGPISDNAQGVFEMSGAGHVSADGALAVQRLDAAGNTTKALTKGFAIATAVVAAVALFHSFVEAAKLETVGMPLQVPEIFVGFLIGGAVPFLFSAFLINAVGRASFDLIGEVRRQFKADAGIMAGTSKPDYGRCVAIVTAAAQKELLGPGILAIAFPLLVVFGLGIGKESTYIDGSPYNLVGAQALGAFLAGTILSGQLLAVLLANSGGIWDNAKKIIEDGLHGGKGTEAHKAGVVCDTVGDPFKDTAGPALNPLIKVMNLVALLLAPYVIFPGNDMLRITITVIAVLALVYAIMASKKGSMSSEMTRMTNEEKSA